MAKSSTRVHILAKELGVKSKAIVEKCQAEGLDIKNHMSTITIGLAATIREWFSEGEHANAVETSKRVDLEKVKVPKKRAKKKTVEAEAEEAVEAVEAVATVEVEVEAGAEVAEMPSVPVEEAVVEVQPGAEVAEAEQKTEEPKVEEPAKPAGPVFVEPPRPEVVVPAGPMLEKPKPAKLAGPKVVRIEEVEHVEIRPRRPRAPRPKYDAPISEPLMPSTGDAGGSGKGKRGGGRGDKTHGRKQGGGGGEADRSGRQAGRRVRSKDLEERRARLAAARGESSRSRPSRKIEARKAADVAAASIERPEKANVSEPITIKDLSSAIMVRSGEIIKKLMQQGIMAGANQTIATEVAEMISLEFGTELIVELKQTVQEQIEAELEAIERTSLKRRPPIITMLGHVDHGKTSLLDRIRSTSVADGEAGGITQHIGAYQVEWKGKKVTFLDTPGHEAFTAMRARGANMTDVVVLVVAADDGLMPQTIEAIHHAKAAGVDMIVALNKIDLPGVDINRIYGQLAEHELTPAEWGGNTEIVKTSAITGEGIEDLIEHLDYIADLKEYKADTKVPANGWVVESKMTTTQGATATILIKEGELKKGDVMFSGSGYGRIRTMKNSLGRALKKAGGSTAVEVTGLSEAPQAGDKFFALKDINRAKAAADDNRARSREKSLARRSNITLENLFSQIEAGNIKELNLIIKADVQGSVDVLIKYLTDLSTDEIKIKVLHAAVGGVAESDVVLAEASGAIIIGFNVVPDDRVKSIADASGVDIRLYNIIYRITEDLKDAMLGMLDAKFEEKQIGKLIVRDTFRHSRVGTIAGCLVSSGIISKKAKLRMIRDNIVIRESCSIDSLKHFKEDVREVKAGNECGIKIAGFDDIKIDDVFEAYESVELARKL